MRASLPSALSTLCASLAGSTRDQQQAGVERAVNSFQNFRKLTAGVAACTAGPLRAASSAAAVQQRRLHPSCAEQQLC